MLGVFTFCSPAQVSQPLGVYLQTRSFVSPSGSRRHIDSLSSFAFPSVIPELVATAGGQGSRETLDFPRELPPVFRPSLSHYLPASCSWRWQRFIFKVSGESRRSAALPKRSGATC